MDTLLQFALRSCSAESIPVSSLYLLLFEREKIMALCSSLLLAPLSLSVWVGAVRSSWDLEVLLKLFKDMNI